ncbi:MAG TPA: DUF2961 domain-containing protein [Polyangiales bacterium]|nr:DUF2961 domain-containing protein [Polyangiales bacterium]
MKYVSLLVCLAACGGVIASDPNDDEVGSATPEAPLTVETASSLYAPSSHGAAALSDVIVAPETADLDALTRLADVRQLPVFGRGRYEQHSSRDRGRGLSGWEWFSPILSYNNRDMNNFVCRSQDAQLGSSPPFAYAFDQELCPESYVHGVVLSRHEGSGRLVRVWMTMSSVFDAKAGDEQFRIYVDDDPTPVIQVPLADVISGAAGEIFAPPFGAASKHFLAWYYPVVFSRKVLVVIDGLESAYYFQTDAVLDVEPTPRRAPEARMPERDRAIALLSAQTSVPAAAKRLHAEPLQLRAGQTQEITLQGPATVQELLLSFEARTRASVADIDVTVYWDGALAPALDLPLLELFAAGRTSVEVSNLQLAASVDADEQRLALRLAMPFRESAKWRLTNRGTGDAQFQLTWQGVQTVPSADFGHLYVQRKDVAIPALALEVTVAEASGRGRYVGMCADVACHTDLNLLDLAAPLNCLEGDFRALADGRSALDGTGAEDYPDNAFYFLDSPRATPFAQAWGKISDDFATPAGQVSYCRWQVLGTEIDFESKFVLTHELSQVDPALAALHRTVAFLYMR